MNPASIMKLMKAKDKFSETHPKFINFIHNIFGSGVPEGTVLELTVTKPGEQPVTTNIVVKESDLELIEELKGMARK